MGTIPRSEAGWVRLARKAGWRVKRMARLCGVTERTLRRRFGEGMGRGLGEWLRRRRMEEARDWLARGLTVKEVSGLVGYGSVAALERAYWRYWGVWPGGDGRGLRVREF